MEMARSAVTPFFSSVLSSIAVVRGARGVVFFFFLDDSPGIFGPWLLQYAFIIVEEFAQGREIWVRVGIIDGFFSPSSDSELNSILLRVSPALSRRRSSLFLSFSLRSRLCFAGVKMASSPLGCLMWFSSPGWIRVQKRRRSAGDEERRIYVDGGPSISTSPSSESDPSWRFAFEASICCCGAGRACHLRFPHPESSRVL